MALPLKETVGQLDGGGVSFVASFLFVLTLTSKFGDQH